MFSMIKASCFQPAAMNAKKFWNGQPESSALLAWNPVWADISATGALGYTTGDWDFRPKGIDDKTDFVRTVLHDLEKNRRPENFKAVLDIGISHAKPADVKKYWMSPAVMSEHRNRESDIAAPEFAFLTLDDYEKLLAHDVRIYREQKLPFIGKQNALTQIKSERARTKSGRVVGSSCASSGDLFYCYGVLEFTSNDDSVKKGNLVRIWKRRNDRWVITLEGLHAASRWTVIPQAASSWKTGPGSREKPFKSIGSSINRLQWTHF